MCLDLSKVTAPFEIGVVDEYAGIAVGLPSGQLVFRAAERWLVGSSVDVEIIDYVATI